MNGDGNAGREYAEIWGETVRANRKLRTILIFLSASCVLGVFVLLRIAGAEPPKPIVIRVDDVGRAEALAYEAATAQADPLDPTTKYFLNRFVDDFHSRRRATVEEHWTRSLRFLSTELANAAFSREGDEVAATAAGTAGSERQVERVVVAPVGQCGLGIRPQRFFTIAERGLGPGHAVGWCRSVSACHTRPRLLNVSQESPI